jgi:hypothetical protein
MTMQTLYHITKIFHIVGFTTAIGITLATFVAYKQFWNLYAISREQGLASFRAFKALQIVGMIGFMVVLVAGIGMLVIMKWTFISFLWFQIKLGLILLLFVNGVTLGRTSSMKLDSFLEQRLPEPVMNTEELRNRTRTFLWYISSSMSALLF